LGIRYDEVAEGQAAIVDDLKSPLELSFSAARSERHAKVTNGCCFATPKNQIAARVGRTSSKIGGAFDDGCQPRLGYSAANNRRGYDGRR
jgi:hypothetical protein